ncbi:MAG TPA: DUF4870 domain-containing protein [Nodosilinea sp.]|nr:DUF4870 domain-containing protein [Nodosilinea sp.]
MALPLSALIAQARQGDAQAIALLLTRSLAAHRIVASGQRRGAELLLSLEAEQAIPQEPMVLHIRRGLRRLGLTGPVERVWVVGRRVGQGAADWQVGFGLNHGLPDGLTDAPPPNAPPTDGPPPSAPLTDGPPPSAPLTDGPPPDRAGLGSEREPASPPAPAALPAGPGAPPRAELSDGPEASPGEPYLSETALATLVQLVPLFSYLMVGSQWWSGWPLFWGGSFVLPWRVVAPLVLVLAQGAGTGSAALRQQAKAALNFQLTMMLAWLVTIALMFVLVGFLLVVPLALLEVVSCVVAAVRAAEGKPVRYWGAIRFVR